LATNARVGVDSPWETLLRLSHSVTEEIGTLGRIRRDTYSCNPL